MDDFSLPPGLIPCQGKKKYQHVQQIIQTQLKPFEVLNDSWQLKKPEPAQRSGNLCWYIDSLPVVVCPCLPVVLVIHIYKINYIVFGLSGYCNGCYVSQIVSWGIGIEFKKPHFDKNILYIVNKLYLFKVLSTY